MKKWTLYLSILIGLSLSACRRDQPPQLSIICQLDGFGGGDCVTSDGTRKYMSPSEMKNMWATTQTDEANFASWCYKAPKQMVKAEMTRIKAQIAGR